MKYFVVLILFFVLIFCDNKKDHKSILESKKPNLKKEFFDVQYEISKKIKNRTKSITNFYVNFSSDLIYISKDKYFGKACADCPKTENHYNVDSAGYYHLYSLSHLEKKYDTILSDEMNNALEGFKSTKGLFLVDSLHSFRDELCSMLFTYNDSFNNRFFYNSKIPISLLDCTHNAKNLYLNQLRKVIEKCNPKDKCVIIKIHRKLTIPKMSKFNNIDGFYPWETINFEGTATVKMIAILTSLRTKCFEAENIGVNHIVKRLGIKQN